MAKKRIRPASKRAKPARLKSDSLLSMGSRRYGPTKPRSPQDLREWQNIVALWRAGKLRHLTRHKVYVWCVENLGFNCSERSVWDHLSMGPVR